MKQLKVMFAITLVAAATIGASVLSRKSNQEKSLAEVRALLFDEQVEALTGVENLTLSESSSSTIPTSNYNSNGSGWGYEKRVFYIEVPCESDSTSVNSSNSQEMAACIVIKQNVGVGRGKANKTGTSKPAEVNKKTALQSFCEWVGNQLIRCN